MNIKTAWKKFQIELSTKELSDLLDGKAVINDQEETAIIVVWKEK